MSITGYSTPNWSPCISEISNEDNKLTNKDQKFIKNINDLVKIQNSVDEVCNGLCTLMSELMNINERLNILCQELIE